MRYFFKEKFLAIIIISLLFISCATHRQEIKERSELPAIPPASPVLIYKDLSEKKILKEALDSILSSSLLESVNTGILIFNLNSGDTVYAKNERKLFVPASLTKIVTSAVSIVKLRPEYTFRTLILSNGTQSDRIFSGNIYLVGGGDPTLSTSNLEKMAEELRRMGIRKIFGNLVVDESFFDFRRWGNGWMWEEGTNAYVPVICGLSLNRNTIQITLRPGEKKGDKGKVEIFPVTKIVNIQNEITTDSLEGKIHVERVFDGKKNTIIVRGKISISSKAKNFWRTIDEPQIYAGQIFYDALKRFGISLSGKIIEGKSPLNTRVLCEHSSKPLSLIILEMNKESDNFYAEQILKTLGSEIYGPPGTAEKGIKVVEKFLDSLGIKAGEYRMVDASGLSRYNLFSPGHFVNLLSFMYSKFSWTPEFISSLSVGGSDGTLERRLFEFKTGRNVRAKTGTMSGISCLCGYLENRKKEILVFCIMMNGFVGNSESIRAVQDEILKKLF